MNNFLIHTNFLTLIRISLLYYCPKVFILMNIILKKKIFYSHLNMEDITDTDYAHAKRVCKDFENKNLGEYHDLFVQNITLLLSDVFENFINMCLEMYELYLANFLSAPGIRSFS